MKFATLAALAVVADAKQPNYNQLNKRLNHKIQSLQARHTPAAAPTGLWSVGMTASKTAAVNTKLQNVARDAMALGNDPVYGPFIEQHQAVLFQDIDAAFTKYQSAMEAKYNSDPAFKAKCDALMVSEMDLGNELDNEAGWTFEDNDGSLQRAANSWNQF